MSIFLRRFTTRKLAFLLAPILLSGCAALEQIGSRIESGQPDVQNLAIQAAAPPAPVTTPKAAPPATPTVSQQTQRELDQMLLCREPIRPDALVGRMTREHLFAGRTQIVAGIRQYRLAVPLTVLGYRVKTIGIEGTAKKGQRQYIEAVVDARNGLVMKAARREGLRLRKVPKASIYLADGKYGHFGVWPPIKDGARVSCLARSYTPKSAVRRAA